MNLSQKVQQVLPADGWVAKYGAIPDEPEQESPLVGWALLAAGNGEQGAQPARLVGMVLTRGGRLVNFVDEEDANFLGYGQPTPPQRRAGLLN